MAHSRSPEAGPFNREELSPNGTILVVDNDPQFLARMRDGFEHQGFRVICSETRKGALAKAASAVIDIALLDHRLRGRENGLALGMQLRNEHGIPFVLVSGFLNTKVTVQAVQVGAADVLDKPIAAEAAVTAIRRVLAGDRAPLPAPWLDDLEEIGSFDEELPDERLARLVLRACAATRDPYTLSRLARAAAISTSAFRAACELCIVQPHSVRDLGRVLRAIALSLRDSSPIISHFSARDPRTALDLLRRAGLDSTTRHIELHAFLQGQRLVEVPSEFVRALGHLASHSPLFFPQDEYPPRDRGPNTQD